MRQSHQFLTLITDGMRDLTGVTDLRQDKLTRIWDPSGDCVWLITSNRSAKADGYQENR